MTGRACGEVVVERERGKRGRAVMLYHCGFFDYPSKEGYNYVLVRRDPALVIRDARSIFSFRYRRLTLPYLLQHLVVLHLVLDLF